MPIIAEAPALPGVPAFLGSLMRDSAESATLALSVLRDVVQSRPQDRSSALNVVRVACSLAVQTCTEWHWKSSACDHAAPACAACLVLAWVRALPALPLRKLVPELVASRRYSTIQCSGIR